jgi:predicted PurR-regulated permease PerM
MTSGTARPAVELAPSAPARPKLALALALISVPGVTIAWDVAAALAWAGVAVAIAAIVVGLQARSRLPGGRGRVMASAAVVIAGLAALSVIVFLIIGAPD